jgi:hypothetical protein
MTLEDSPQERLGRHHQPKLFAENASNKLRFMPLSSTGSQVLKKSL